MRYLSRFHVISLLCCCLSSTTGTLVLAQAAAKPTPPPVGTLIAPSQSYDKLLSGVEKEFVDAAEAMPEDKYNFAPATTMGDFKGVRTFAEQVKHVAEANAYFFHDPAAPTADDRADYEKLKTKAEILKKLKDSFVLAHTYIAAITPENAFVMTKNGTRAGTASLGVAHMLDHYGQMVVYLRMNNIVPPASRGNSM